MSDLTRHFGLNRLAQDSRLSDDGHKFGDRDREILDALLFTLFSHDHSATGIPVVSPVGDPDVVVSTSGGGFPAGADQYYRISFIDQFGNETAASREALADLPDKISPFSAPALALTSTGGTLTTGTYQYAVGTYQILGVTRRTTAASHSSIQIASGATNKVTITLPVLETTATGWDIWRKSPSDSDFYLLAQKVGVNEVQELYNGASSGTFTLTFDGEETGDIAYNATAINVEAALVVLSTIVDVSVSGAGTVGDPWVITFIDPAFQNVETLTVDDANLVGGTSTISTPTQGSTLTYEDTGAVSPTVTLTRPVANDTNSENLITVTISDVDKPLSKNITGWRLYRTNRSGVYPTNSLVGLITETVTEGGDTLIDTFEDDGVGLQKGIPLDVSSVPIEVPALFNPAPLSFYLSDSTAEIAAGDHAQFTTQAAFNVRKMEAFFRDAPNCDGSNYVTIRITDKNPVDEVQEVWNDAIGGTFTLTFDGQITATINYNDNAATVETRLQALSNIVDVNVTGAGTEADPWVITFVDPGDQDVEVLVPDDTNLTGHVLGTTVTTTTAGSPITLEEIVVNSTAQYWSKETDYWSFSAAEGYLEAESVTATKSGGTVVADADASDGNAYRIINATSFTRWNIGNIPTGDYKFRFVLAQGSSNDVVQLKIQDLDGPSTLLDASVNAVSNYTLYEYDITVSSGTNDIQMEFNGTTTATYFCDSFEYVKVRPDPVLFSAGETVYIEVEITNSPADAGNRVNLLVW